MKKFYSCIAMTLLVALTACASPYLEGRSPADTPAHINVINLQDIYITTNGHGGPNHEPPRDPNPSQNDQEVLAVARASILDQFTNFGYTIVDGTKPADINVKFFVTYQPERWPLVDRSVMVHAWFYDLSNKPIFIVPGIKINPPGLIGYALGPSRDEIVNDAAREAVVKSVDELRKGTFENKSVGK